MLSKKQAEDFLNKIQQAIVLVGYRLNDNPGVWDSHIDERGLWLTWSADEENIDGALQGGEAWDKWGGKEIIKKAGILDTHDDGFCESHKDKYGEDVISNWVLWKIGGCDVK